MNWNDYRNADGTIDLVKAFSAVYGGHRDINFEYAEGYLSMIESLQPIKSRQAASVAIVTAYEMFRHGR